MKQRSGSPWWGVVVGVLALLLVPSPSRAETFVDANALETPETSEEDTSENSKEQMLSLVRPIRWTVPHQKLGHLHHLSLGAGHINGADRASLPYTAVTDLLVRVPIPLRSRWILINSLESKNTSFNYRRPQKTSNHRQLPSLHHLRFSLSTRYVHNRTWSHVVTFGTGYGGDFRSFDPGGMYYLVGYHAFWNNGKNLQIGFGVALAKIEGYYVPFPTLILAWEIVDNLVFKTTLPKELALRYSLDRTYLFGVFARLDSGRYYLSPATENTINGRTVMNGGELKTLRVDIGTEIHFLLWKALYFRLEGGISWINKSTLPSMRLADDNPLRLDESVRMDRSIDAHWTWFAGGGLTFMF
jgi:hypothetical protein